MVTSIFIGSLFVIFFAYVSFIVIVFYVCDTVTNLLTTLIRRVDELRKSYEDIMDQ
jgi:hypothetical protein